MKKFFNYTIAVLFSLVSINTMARDRVAEFSQLPQEARKAISSE